jgi:hypothetical protein
MGSGYIDPCFLYLGIIHCPAALPPEKSPRRQFYRRLDGPQSRSGGYGEVKIPDPTDARTPTPRLSNPYFLWGRNIYILFFYWSTFSFLRWTYILILFVWFLFFHRISWFDSKLLYALQNISNCVGILGREIGLSQSLYRAKEHRTDLGIDARYNSSGPFPPFLHTHSVRISSV